MAQWRKEQTTPGKIIHFEDCFNDIGTAGNADHRWRDEAAGARAKNTTQYIGSDRGYGPDGYAPADRADRGGVTRIISSGTLGQLYTNSIGGNWWSDTNLSLDLSLVAVIGNTIDNASSTYDSVEDKTTIALSSGTPFTDDCLGKKVCFGGTTNGVMGTITDVVSSSVIKVRGDLTSLVTTLSGSGTNKLYVPKFTHCEFDWYNHGGADEKKLEDVTFFISSSNNNPNADNITWSPLGSLSATENQPNEDFSMKDAGRHTGIVPIGLRSSGQSTFKFDDIRSAEVRVDLSSTGSLETTAMRMAFWELDDAPRFSFSVDDGIYSTDNGVTVDGTTRLADLFDEYGIKGTFYVNPARVNTDGSRYVSGTNVYCNSDDLMELQERGHLIGSHNWNHERMYADISGGAWNPNNTAYAGEKGVSDYLDSCRRARDKLRDLGFEGFDIMATAYGHMRRDVLDAITGGEDPPCRQVRTVLVTNNARPNIRYKSDLSGVIYRTDGTCGDGDTYIELAGATGPGNEFTASMVGNYIGVTGGTNAIKGIYECTGFVSASRMNINRTIAVDGENATGIAFSVHEGDDMICTATNRRFYWPRFLPWFLPWSLNFDQYYRYDMLNLMLDNQQSMCFFTHSASTTPTDSKVQAIAELGAAYQAGTVGMFRMDEMIPSVQTSSGSGSRPPLRGALIR
jgi:hypothetical protein